MAEKAEGLLVSIGTDLKELQKLKRDVDRAVKPVVDRIGRIGDVMTRTVTPAILGAAGASVKLASDFEASMTRINTLVGVAQDQVDGWGKDVLRLAPRLGRAPKELADALFVVTSAGQRGAEAMRILERSGKAAAIGLGETRDIARAVTSAVNAYGIETLNAAKATDILTAIVREGNLEASELAPSIGRILGLAAQLGVSFEELGANIATFTRLGVNAREAITGLRGILAVLIRPTEQAQKAAAELGIDFEAVRKVVQEDGLQAALQQLIAATDGNGEALGNLFPEVEALTNVLGTAGAQGQSYAKILDNIAQSTGIVDEGFERVSETAEQQFNQALASLKSTGVEIGATLLPIMTDLAGHTRVAADTFGSLDENLQDLLVTLGLFAAATGPVLKFVRLIGGTAAIALGSVVALSAVLGNIARQDKIISEQGGSGLGRGLDIGGLRQQAGGISGGTGGFVSGLDQSLSAAGLGIDSVTTSAESLVQQLENAAASADRTNSSVTNLGGGASIAAASVESLRARIAEMMAPGEIGQKFKETFGTIFGTSLLNQGMSSAQSQDGVDLEVTADMLRSTVAPAVNLVTEEARVLQATLGATGRIITHDLANIGARAVGDLVSGFASLEEVIFNVGRAVKGLLSDLIAAVVRAAALKAISAAFGVGGGQTFGQLFLSGIGFGGGRAHGGPVRPGQFYTVGERGPETFVPNTAGRIVPRGGGVPVKVVVSPRHTVLASGDIKFSYDAAVDSELRGY